MNVKKTYRKGQFRPGEKPGPGRPRGSLNKTTAEVREAMAMFVAGNIDQLDAWLRKVKDPGRRIELLVRCCEYVIPRLGRGELEVTQRIDFAALLKERREKVGLTKETTDGEG